MPNIESELLDLMERKFFANIDFLSGYWQLQQDIESQLLLSLMSTDEVVSSKRCSKGAKNAGPNLQAKVEPLFSDISHALKSWPNDFMLHEKNDGALLRITKV